MTPLNAPINGDGQLFTSTLYPTHHHHTSGLSHPRSVCFVFLLSGLLHRMQTVGQLSAVGCRTLWLDHGPHPDHHHLHDGPTEDESSEYEPAASSGDQLEDSSPRGKFSRPRTKAPPRSGTVDEEAPPDDVGGDAGGKARTGESGSGEVLLNGRGALMFLDVEEEIGAAGMVGSSEWLLRWGRRR